MKSVYIILLNWRGWRDTIRCLSSLVSLNYSNYRVIVVDNASGDESVERIKTAFPEIMLISNNENVGFGSGCNVGIRHALANGADYVWLLNNDTIVDPNALDSLVQRAESDNSIGAVGSVLHPMGGDVINIQAWGGGCVKNYLGISRHFVGPVSECRIQYLTGASLLLPASTLKSVGLFDENYFMYWEDTDLGIRIGKMGYKLAVAPKSHIWHKESASLGRTNPRLDYYFTSSSIRFFRKHSGIPLIPIGISLGGRLAKRIFSWKWRNVGEIINAITDEI